MSKYFKILIFFAFIAFAKEGEGTHPRMYYEAVAKNSPTKFQKGVSSGYAEECIYHIGDYAQGGVIIWLTQDGLHGLVAAIDDASASHLQWSTENASTSATNNFGLPSVYTEVVPGENYAGYINQEAIKSISGWQAKYPAFDAAANYTHQGYTGWFLPSSRELSLIYAAASVINAVSTANGGSALKNSSYWSSRAYPPFGNNVAWYIDFSNAYADVDPKSALLYVRCVRAF